MSYTSHGHHIPGTIKDETPPGRVARCGGPNLCSVCARDCLKGEPIMSEDETQAYIDLKKEVDNRRRFELERHEALLRLENEYHNQLNNELDRIMIMLDERAADEKNK